MTVKIKTRPEVKHNGVDDYVYWKKLFDRFKSFKINPGAKEFGWGLEKRNRYGPLNHKSPKKKRSRCACCNLYAHKPRNKHLTVHYNYKCRFWPCEYRRAFSKSLCYSKPEKCAAFRYLSMKWLLGEEIKELGCKGHAI
jgi:hypothetical protein